MRKFDYKRLEDGSWEVSTEIDFARRKVRVYETSKSKSVATTNLKNLVTKQNVKETAYSLVSGVIKPVSKEPTVFELIKVIPN